MYTVLKKCTFNKYHDYAILTNGSDIGPLIKYF